MELYKIKGMVSPYKVLDHFDPNHLIYLEYSASQYSIDFVLLHIINGEEKTVACHLSNLRGISVWGNTCVLFTLGRWFISFNLVFFLSF